MMKKSTNQEEELSLNLDTIKVLIPFSYVLPIDPRGVISVGDQVLVEHIFSYHSKESIISGFEPVTSDVDFNLEKSRITITPKYNLRRSDGSTININDICNSLKQSFSGTFHVPYASLVKRIECFDTKIEIDFASIPTNMKFLFTVPDLALFDQKKLPINKGYSAPTTGPYSIEQIEPSSVLLKRNPFYPEELVSNKIDKVLINSFSPADTDKVLNEVHPSKEHLLYLYGHSLNEEKLNSLKNKGYKIQQFPSEWFLFAGMNDSLDREDKVLITQEIDKIKKELIKSQPFGQEAFSIAPADRPFALTEHEYSNLRLANSPKEKKLSRKITVGSTDSFAKIPLFKELLEKLSQSHLNFEIKIYSRYEFEKMFEEADVYLNFIGMSQADPLSHLSYLISTGKEFASRISPNDIAQVAAIKDFTEFTKATKELETRLIKDMVIIPFGHFPGIVAEAPNFIRDESLAWGWGIQAWTYQVR